MNKVVAYVRVSTDKQEINNQKLELLEFANKKNLRISEFIETVVSTKKSEKERLILDLINNLNTNDILMITELSRLGRSTAGIINIINELLQKNIRVIITKNNLDFVKHDIQSKITITLFSLFAELERDLISLRTKEALASKKSQGISIGKPKGTIQKSKFDASLDKIKELIGYGLPTRKIAKVLGYSSHNALAIYIKKRNIKENIAALAK